MPLLKSTFTSLLLVLLTGVQPVLAQAERFTPQQLHEDFQIAQKALEEGHGGIYRYRPKSEVDRHFAEAERQLDTPADALGFYRILQPAVASIACGHTTSLLPVALRDSLMKESLLPLDVKVLNGRVFVFRDFARAGALAGQEVLSINGVPTARILRTLTAAAHGDGNIATFRAIEIGRAFKQSLYTQLGMRGTFKVMLSNPKSGQRQTYALAGQTLEALQQASLQQYPQDQDSKRFLEYSFLDEGKIARLKVFNFNDEEEDEDGVSLLENIFQALQAKGTQTLLIDMRDNGGGEDALGKLLFSYLVDTPFTYYDSLTVTRAQYSFAKYTNPPLQPFSSRRISARPDGQFNYLRHPNLGLQQPTLPTFRGRVFVLINGGSFSTTSEFLTQVHSHRRATFIGEESGGGYFGNTSGQRAVLTLPNTRVRLVVPLITFFENTQQPHAPDRGVLPDYPVQRTIDDYLAGRDPEWELALTLARKP